MIQLAKVNKENAFIRFKVNKFDMEYSLLPANEEYRIIETEMEILGYSTKNGTFLENDLNWLDLIDGMELAVGNLNGRIRTTSSRN